MRSLRSLNVAAMVFSSVLLIPLTVPAAAGQENQQPAENTALSVPSTYKTARAGDVNLDQKVDVSDVFALINFLYAHGSKPSLADASANGDQYVNSADVFYLIKFLFAGGPAPRCTSADLRAPIDVMPGLDRRVKVSSTGRVELYASPDCNEWQGQWVQADEAPDQNYCGPTAGMNLLPWYGSTATYAQLASEMRTNQWMSGFSAATDCACFCSLGICLIPCICPEPTCSGLCYAVAKEWLNAGTLPPDMQRTLSYHSPLGYRIQAGRGNPGLTEIEDELRKGNPTVVLVWYTGTFYALPIGTLHWTVISGTYDGIGGVWVRFANAGDLSWDEFVHRWSWDGMNSAERSLLEDKEGLHPLMWYRYEKATELRAGQSLTRFTAGNSITSSDGRFMLILDDGGNLVLYQLPMQPPNFPSLWKTNTPGSNAQEAVMQSDGNFVLYGSTGNVLWSSHTYGHSGAYLALQNDGNLVIYDANNTTVLWASNTCCH